MSINQTDEEYPSPYRDPDPDSDHPNLGAGIGLTTAEDADQHPWDIAVDNGSIRSVSGLRKLRQRLARASGDVLADYRPGLVNANTLAEIEIAVSRVLAADPHVTTVSEGPNATTADRPRQDPDVPGGVLFPRDEIQVSVVVEVDENRTVPLVIPAGENANGGME